MPILQENNKGSFDFIFVDADKDNYLNYHEKAIELVKIGGLIGYDNTLWNGSVVAPPDAPLMDYIRHYRGYVLELNKYLAQDSRIEICQLSGGWDYPVPPHYVITPSTSFGFFPMELLPDCDQRKVRCYHFIFSTVLS